MPAGLVLILEEHKLLAHTALQLRDFVAFFTKAAALLGTES